MTITDFLTRYGVFALFALATVEGDVSLVVGGVLAHRGLMSLPQVMVAGALGNLLGDLGWFAVGRHLRERIRNSRLYQRVGPRIEALAKRLGAWQLLAARVVYGTRIFNLQASINHEERNRHLTIKASEGLNNGQ